MMGDSWGGHLPNLPLKHLEVIIFPSAKHFSENAGSSEVNDQNHVYLLLGYQHFCSKRMSSQALEQHPVQNQTDIQCWCSIQGKSASESSGRGDPGT